MLFKNIRLCLAVLLLMLPALTQAEPSPEATESADAAAVVPSSEMSETELHEMLGFLTAMGGGVATLELNDAEIAKMADGLIQMLEGETDLRDLPRPEVEKAFAEAQSRAEAVESDAAESPGFSEGSLEKIGMVIAVQSGLTRLGFGAAEAESIRAGFLKGATATEPPADLEAKMPVFEAYIEQRIELAQEAIRAEEEKAREAAMAEFKSIAEEWSGKENINVVLETTQGAIELELYPKHAPLAVANFVGHIENGYYDGLLFHRVIDDFMIQGGDPMGTGSGGESIWGKPFPDEFTEALRFDEEGLLAMANAGPMTNGSQFFITTSKPGGLNDRHTIFGKVVSGYSAVEAIEKTDTNAQDRPMEDQKIIKAYVKK